MKVLGLINARAGSKGVVGKNIKMLGSKPLIAWAIDVGNECSQIDRVVVSTESTEIAEVARQYGADIPFMRPMELATDQSIQLDTILYTVQKLEELGDKYDAVMLLQPTCPMRTVEDMERSIQLMQDTGADTVVSVTETDGGLPNALYYLEEDLELTPFQTSSNKGVLRQQFKPLYKRTGGIYLIKRDVLFIKKALYGDSVIGCVVDPRTAFNIDTMFDWELIEAWVCRNEKS